MLNSSVLLKVLYPQPLILPCLCFFLNSPFIISDVKQHILTWHSSWKVKMHATIIFNQKTLLNMEWVHTFHLTWKMYYKMILLEVPWNGLENSYWKSKSLKGILRSFHQKNKNIFSWLQFFKHKTLHQHSHFMKKWGKKDQILKMLMVAILCSFNICCLLYNHQNVFLKVFHNLRSK